MKRLPIPDIASRHYLLFFKPCGVLSQFTSRLSKRTLGAFGPFPPHVYTAGRLDEDSEGLLLLTDDGELIHRMTDPRFQHPKTYLVQVEGRPDNEAVRQLREGVMIEGRVTRPALVRIVESEPALPPRAVPIRVRRTIPTTWVEITLREGRNRQVRRMTAAVGLPALRVVRTRIGPLSVGTLGPGEHRRLGADEIRALRESIGLGRGRRGKKRPRRT